MLFPKSQDRGVLRTDSGACRICGAATRAFLDLGKTPPANWLVATRSEKIDEFPLVLESCLCGNFQLQHCLEADTLYRHYNYVTPQSPLLNAHYERLISYLMKAGYLNAESNVLEIGSNVGHFLAYLIPKVRSVLGVDPAQNIAEIANAHGIPTVADFFNKDVAGRLARDRGEVEVIFARHCMAHNRNPYLILDGIAELLSENGVFVLENAYAITTFENNEFDQIYHEHMFYFSLRAVEEMLKRRGFVLHDVLFSSIHGGSICCIAKRAGSNTPIRQSVIRGISREKLLLEQGLAERFANGAMRIQSTLRSEIGDLIAQGKSIYAYGATAKGATLLNCSGMTYHEIPFCADSTHMKQGRFIPKCGVEIVSEEWAFAHPPDVFLLTAWNYRDEIISKVRAAGLHDVQFIVPVPEVEIVIT